MKIKTLLALGILVLCLSGCVADSELASYNISQEAHKFNIYRRVVFYNGITGEYILEVRGFCSVTPESDGRLSVIVKTENGKYLKHYLGLSDNVTYFCEQLKQADVGIAKYKVIFKPSVILPDIEVR